MPVAWQRQKPGSDGGSRRFRLCSTSNCCGGLWGAEAIAAGYGGVSLVSRITNIARSTINRGIQEFARERDATMGGFAAPAAGAKSKTSRPGLLADLEALVEPATRGDPMSRCCGQPRACAISSAALEDNGA